MTALYYSGSDSQIRRRLAEDGRQCSHFVALHIHTRAGLDGTKGALDVIANQELWPCCPVVGDIVSLESYRVGDEDMKRCGFMRWKVVQRELLPASPTAPVMHGIIDVIVELVSG